MGHYGFRKEGDRWKLDLTSIMSVGDQALKALIRESGLSEDEFIASILESVSGTKVTGKVWQPMIR